MLTRVLTSVIGIPVAIIIMMLGSTVLQVAALIIALIGISEFYSVIKQRYQPMIVIGYASVVIYFLCFNWSYEYFAIYCVLLLSILLMWMVFTYPRHNIVDVGLTLVGTIYVAGLLSFIVLIRGLQHGEFLVWMVFISSWGSDTCAYFAGRFFGKHKLAPVLSPKKTVEGAIGGAIGAAVIGYIYSVIYMMFNPIFDTKQIFIIIGVIAVAAILSQIGDLAASAIKRYFEVKDYGKLFPGHGGVLDRFDSVLMVAPFIYIMISLFRGVGMI